MSVSSDRFEMMNRLRSSNDRDSVLAATNMLKLLSSAIVAQTSRTNTIVSDYLEASVACIIRFPTDEEISENIVCAVCSLASSKKEYAHAIYCSGMIPQFISLMKGFPRNRNINTAVLRILLELCTVEKRASVIIRLQGGLIGALELLVQPCFESDQKITRYVFDFFTAMTRKSTVSASIIAKNRGVHYILLAARRHLLNGRVFQSTLALFDRLCAVKSTVSKMAESSGFIQLIFDAMGHYKYVPRTFIALMQILKSVAGTHVGCEAIRSAGGFDTILTLIEHNLIKPTTLRSASLLLWHLQREGFENITTDERFYNLKSSHFRVNFPQGELHRINDDDGCASDDSYSDPDVEDDETHTEGAELGSNLQSQIDPARGASEKNWKPEQFMPELWSSRDPNAEDFFRRSAQETSLNAKPHSVRDLLPHPESMLMVREDGSPGNINPEIEHQYLPIHSQILATMNASSDRFRTGRKFQHRVVYDRGIYDGSSFDLPIRSTKPKTIFGANSVEEEDGPNCIEPCSSRYFQNLLVDAREKHDSAPGLLVPVNQMPLSFESRFESGNLFRAILVSETEYDLILSSDINTSGRTQWFLFRVENMRADIPYKFNIINLEKPDSAFNRGMRPVMYSKLSAENGQNQWCRANAATDIGYFLNFFRKPNSNTAKRTRPKGTDCDEYDYYHTLTFTITFPYANDSVYLAYFYPFTFTYQQHCLSFLETKTKRCEFMRRQILCYSLGGNAVDLLTITNFKSSVARIQQRPVVVLSARIHPGETNSSWVMKGVLEFLTGDSDVAHFLRENAVFKIIPMLNPDGVIEGNYRCSLSGHDQNRQWIDPDENLSPVVFNARRLITSIAKDRQLLMFCDFHGHSVTSNFMLYGNDEMDCSPMLKPTPNPLSKFCKDGNKKPIWMATVGENFGNKERIFPAMLARRAFKLFSMEQCNFAVQKARAGTARVVLWRELGLAFCFTLEATFSGGTFGPFKGLLYNTDHYETMGHELCRTIADLLSPDQDFVSRAALEISCELTQDSKIKKRIQRQKQVDARPVRTKPTKRT